jgi:branched-chain amino acid transport system substrate-binding protein
MVADKVVFVAGHYCSGSSIPASDIYKEAKILQITPASTNIRLTDEALPRAIPRCSAPAAATTCRAPPSAPTS